MDLLLGNLAGWRGILAFKSSQFLFLEPNITSHKFASRGFTICTAKDEEEFSKKNGEKMEEASGKATEDWTDRNQMSCVQNRPTK